MPYELTQADLDQAAADADADLERVAHMKRRERRYLEKGPKLPDPLTDGIDCDTDERPDGDPDPDRGT